MIGLFVGIESFNWQKTDFDQLASFCKARGVDQVILKVYEITQGMWYAPLGGAQVPAQWLKDAGLDVLPYAFLYGNDVQTEAFNVNQLRTTFDKLCLDMESGWDGQPAKTKEFAGLINQSTKPLYISTWANPVTHNWSDNITTLDPIMSGGAWMPQAYDDNLVKDMYSQFPRVQSPIWPTFHVVNTPSVDAQPFNNFTLWEYQDAQNNQGLLTQYVTQNKGEPVATYPTNNRGMVAELLQVSQFQPNHSEFECGAFAVAVNMRATNANTPNNYNISNLVDWAEAEYAKTAGSNAPSNSIGASIDNMHTMLKDTQSDPNPASHLHWWDISSIGPNSTQSSDIAQIKAALQHGYTVIATVSESSVFDLDLNSNPYWWGPSGNHIITYVGIASDGNLLVADPANVIEANLQGVTQTRAWPRRYDIRSIANQWATVIQHPWNPPIPNDNPVSWPAYQPPTPPSPPPPQNEIVGVMYDPTGKTLMFIANNQVVYRINL